MSTNRITGSGKSSEKCPECVRCGDLCPAHRAVAAAPIPGVVRGPGVARAKQPNPGHEVAESMRQIVRDHSYPAHSRIRAAEILLDLAGRGR